MRLTNQEYAVFSKYHCKYQNTEINKENLKRQKRLFYNLKTKSESTYADKLLELIVDDIHNQFELKQHIENKVGFLLALWGVLLGIVFEQDIFEKFKDAVFDYSMGYFVNTIRIISIVLLYVASFLTFYMLYRTITISKYSSVDYGNKSKFFDASIEDKDIALTILIDTNINTWAINEKANNKKARYLKRSLDVMIVYICLIVLCVYM